MTLQFELTNFQRKYQGLDLVEDTWDIVQINEEVFLYFDNDIIRKRIIVTCDSYHECEMMRPLRAIGQYCFRKHHEENGKK